MAKKGKNYEPTTEAQDATAGVVTDMQPVTVNPDVQAAAEAAAAPATTPAIPRGFHLVANQPDVHGRVNYRFGKEDNYPKKAEGMNVLVDDIVVRMAVTSSGGWANEATKGYNGWFRFDHPTRGLVAGWILFGHGVDPRQWAPEGVDTPPRLSFKITDGTCEANPKREPVNPEAEAKRLEAAELKRKAKAAAAEGAPPAGETPPTTEGEAQPTTEGETQPS